MTTIARIGDKLYADRKISSGVKLLNFNIEQEMCKIIKYEGSIAVIKNLELKVISAIGKFQDFSIFLSMFEDMISLATPNTSEEKEYILDVFGIIKTIIFNLGRNNNKLDISIVFGGTNIDTNKANYFILDMDEGSFNDLPNNSVIGSGKEVIDSFKYVTGQRYVTEEMLPFISKFDACTSRQFDVYDPYTGKIKSLLKNPNGQLPVKYKDFGKLIADGYQNKLLSE